MALCNMRGLEGKEAAVCAIAPILFRLMCLLKILFHLHRGASFSIQLSASYLAKEEIDVIGPSDLPLSDYQYSLGVYSSPFLNKCT